MSPSPNNGPSLSGMRTWTVSYGKRRGNTSLAMLRDELRQRNKQRDAEWRKRRKEQRELAKKREQGFRKHLAAQAKRTKLNRTKAAQERHLIKKKDLSLFCANPTNAAKKRAARLERLLIEARKSAAFYRKRKADKRREARKES